LTSKSLKITQARIFNGDFSKKGPFLPENGPKMKKSKIENRKSKIEGLTSSGSGRYSLASSLDSVRYSLASSLGKSRKTQNWPFFARKRAKNGRNRKSKIENRKIEQIVVGVQKELVQHFILTSKSLKITQKRIVKGDFSKKGHFLPENGPKMKKSKIENRKSKIEGLTSSGSGRYSLASSLDSGRYSLASSLGKSPKTQNWPFIARKRAKNGRNRKSKIENRKIEQIVVGVQKELAQHFILTSKSLKIAQKRIFKGDFSKKNHFLPENGPKMEKSKIEN
jgi:hypothetical protein